MASRRGGHRFPNPHTRSARSRSVAGPVSQSVLQAVVAAVPYGGNSAIDGVYAARLALGVRPTGKPADVDTDTRADGDQKETSVPPKKKTGTQQSLEATLWAAATKLRGKMDTADYKHVVLG